MSNELARETAYGITHKDIHEKSIEHHLERIQREFKLGFEFLQKYPRSVSMFGSSMLPQDHPYSKHAYEVARRVAADLGYAVINGGGPGIMEATSRGATDGGGKAIGLRINLLRERTVNTWTSDGIDFTYFFTRKTMLAFAAEAYVFFPGGFGTMDELFGVLTLIQTLKIPRVPIILFESVFWNPLKDFLIENTLTHAQMIDRGDLNLFEITDSPERVLEIIRRAPVSEWWRNIS